MSAAPVDTSLGSLRTRLDGPRRAMLRTITAVEGHDESETEALHRIVEDRYMALPSAHSVETGTPCPESPEGGPGQGEAQPPAPGPALLIYRHPLTHIHIDGGPCVFGERCEQ